MNKSEKSSPKFCQGSIVTNTAPSPAPGVLGLTTVIPSPNMFSLRYSASLRYLEHIYINQQERKNPNNSNNRILFGDWKLQLCFPICLQWWSVIMWNEKPWIIDPVPICLWGPVCIKPKDDLIFKLVSELLPWKLKDTTYLFKESSVEVKEVIHGDSTITFPQLPFIKHVPSHEPWIISFLSTLLFPLNLSKTLLDSAATVLTAYILTLPTGEA